MPQQYEGAVFPVGVSGSIDGVAGPRTAQRTLRADSLESRNQPALGSPRQGQVRKNNWFTRPTPKRFYASGVRAATFLPPSVPVML
jgi:hypothetical protein